MAKKKKGKIKGTGSGDDSMGLDVGFDFEDQDISSISDVGMGGGGGFDDVMTKLEEIETKLSRLDTSNQTLKNEVENVRSNIDRTEENVKKLLNVYEVVNKNVNPFIDVKEDPDDDWHTSDSDILPSAASFQMEDDFTVPLESEYDDYEDDDDVSFSDPSIESEEDEKEDKELETSSDDKKKEEKKQEKKKEDIIDLFFENLITDEDPYSDLYYGAEYRPPFILEDLPPWQQEMKRRVDMRQGYPVSPKRKFDIKSKMPVKVPAKKKIIRKKIPVKTPVKPIEKPFNLEVVSKNTEGEILTFIKPDYITIVLVLRWIEFMFERVKRDKIPRLLEYYKDIGWISETAKSQIMSYARGEIQDVTSYEPEEDDELLSAYREETEIPRDYKKISDWKLSAEDHLKSLLFIQKIAGIEVNKDRLNSLEQEISIFKRSLEGFHGV